MKGALASRTRLAFSGTVRYFDKLLTKRMFSTQVTSMPATAAHELGHAIFDMPAAVAKGAARAFRSGAIAARDAAPIDWREWRADEFMGAFLAPRRQLVRSFAREASAIGAAIRWKVIDEIPTPYVAANVAGWPAIDAIAGALAEEFGVTSAFIGVRLRKYGLVG